MKCNARSNCTVSIFMEHFRYFAMSKQTDGMVTAIYCVYKFTQLCIKNTVQLYSVYFLTLHKTFFNNCVVQSSNIYARVGLSVT
jgi:hypothetical protein